MRESGQVFPLVLLMLMAGMLLVTPALSFASTNLNSQQIFIRNTDGMYAADAGAEYAIWCLQNGTTPSAQLPETINGMQVDITSEYQGSYTLYLGGFVQTSQHSNYISMDSEITWDEVAEAYLYTTTITWQADSGTPVIHMEEVGAHIPEGFLYQANSAALFGDNLDTDEPVINLDAQGAQLLSWILPSPKPSVSETDPTATQQFYIAGTEEIDGEYTWVVANRDDIGVISELTGSLYEITSIASEQPGGTTTGQVIASVLDQAGCVYKLSWRIVK